jgi:hypothetical protein
VILPSAVAQGVTDGTVNLVFRRWARPNVKAGDTLRTTSGVIEVESIRPIDPAAISDADALKAGLASAVDVVTSLRRSPGGTVFAIRVRWIGPDPRIALSADANLTDADVTSIRARLARLDARSSHGAWTHETLRVVAELPGRRAGGVAATLGREKESMKLDIRKLKNLGLTHSLATGYEISPRGSAYLRRASRE